MAADGTMTNKKRKQLQIVVIVLLILVLITGAVALVLHFHAKNAINSESVKITQNVIGSTTVNSTTALGGEKSETNNNDNSNATASSSSSDNKDMHIELSKGKKGANEPFEMTGMVPGDSETKSFNLTVHNKKPVKVFFSANKKNEENNYSDALDIQVKDADNGEVLFSGTFNDFINKGATIEVPQEQDNVAKLNYTINVSMDIEKDNRYQYGKLVADFNWEVAKEDTPSLEKIPSTGDASTIYALMGVAVVAVITLAICLSRSKKKAGDEQI